MKELLKSIGITAVGNYGNNGDYIIDIESSDKWGSIYTKLENSDLVELQEDSSLLTQDEASLIYLSDDDYQLVLVADFDNDLYKLVVSKLGDK